MPDAAPIDPEPASPSMVSVIVPMYGRTELTVQCLASLRADTTRTPFDIIVVDDGTPGADVAASLTPFDATVIRTPQNLGFVGACNLGARCANGTVLAFLNNDTIVHSGWLDALVEVLDTRPDVGLVGSLLLGSDGRVQESGSIVWADGTAWNYGRGLPPEFAEVTAVRDVDYCSGAAIAIRADLFRRLGGFDERYAPAYYEDTDLCFAVRAAGHRVVVQPSAVVTHLEGATAGHDGGGGIKRFQTVNRVVFAHRWRDALAVRDSPPLDNAALWRGRHRTAAGPVLIVDSHLPMPDRDSGSRRMLALIDQLINLGHAVYVAAHERVGERKYRSALEQRGVTCLISADEQDRFIREAGPVVQAVLLCRPTVAWAWLERIFRWAPDAVLLYDSVDLHSLRMEREAELTGDEALRRRAALAWVMESAAMRAADIAFVVSSVEWNLVRERLPDVDVRILSNVHNVVVEDPTPAGRRREMVFVGGYQHPPNVDAARWAAHEILPRVRRQVPDAILRLIGSNMPDELAALRAPGLIAQGWVEDLAPVYRAARVAIAPLRFGAGVKGKVGEAIEHGVPLVGTSVAVEGMSFVAGVDLEVADDVDHFAAAAATLLLDDDAWTRMAGAGQQRLNEQFSPTRAKNVLAGALATPTQRPRSRPLAVRTSVPSAGG